MLDDRILEKPDDEEHAVSMLQSLAGRGHEVVTGVCLITREKESLNFFDVNI